MPPALMPAPQLLAVFASGPVLLVIDADDPAHRGLPAACAGHYVLVPLVGEWHREAVQNGAARLQVGHSAEFVDGVADLSLHDSVALIGRMPGGVPAPVVNPAAAQRLGETVPLLMHELLAGLGFTAPQPIWSLPTTEVERQESARAAVPNKLVALERARAGKRPVWLGLKLGVPTLKVAGTPPPGADTHNLLLMPDTPDVEIGEAGIGWRQATPANPSDAMFVPWGAVWALRSWDRAVGHLWLADAPPSVRAWAGRSGTLTVDALDVTQGAAMPPVAHLRPSMMLSPPVHWGPDQALRWSKQQGPCVLLVDAAGAGVRVPPGLLGQSVVALPYGFGLPTSVVQDEEGVVANLPDADGSPSTLRAPWSAVVGVQSLTPLLQMAWTWPEHVTAPLRAALHRGPDGHETLSLQQPCGPETPQGRATLQVELKIERFDVN